MTANYTVNDGDAISLDYKVSSEGGCDFFTYTLTDGNEYNKTDSFSSEKEDSIVFDNLTAGNYVLTLTYSKDGSMGSKDDCAIVNISQKTFILSSKIDGATGASYTTPKDLSVGTHTFKLVANYNDVLIPFDGTTITVEEKKDSGEEENPGEVIDDSNTGDDEITTDKATKRDTSKQSPKTGSKSVLSVLAAFALSGGAITLLAKKKFDE